MRKPKPPENPYFSDMNIYKVTAHDYHYDEYDQFIVIARNARRARQMAQDEAGKHQKDVFTEPALSTCVQLKLNKEYVACSSHSGG